MKKTVIVLGAGASFDVNYPTGPEMREHILTTIQRGNGLFDSAVKANFGEERIAHFGDALNRASTLTIDAFLEHRSDLLDIGRFAIAHELTMRENVPIHTQVKNSWYLNFRTRLGSRMEHLKSEELTIITFNYDRSLDHFLFGAYEAMYPPHTEQTIVANAFKKKLSILHVHGVLSPLPWQHPNGRRYEMPQTPESLLEISKHILLPHEECVLKLSDGRSLESVMNEAERIFFLGFGYAKTNLLKLGLESARIDPTKEISGTHKGLEDSDRDAIHAFFSNFSFFNENLEIIKRL
jgi:hypothetical protein